MLRNKTVTTKTTLKGKTYKRLYSAKKFHYQLMIRGYPLAPRKTFDLQDIIKEAIESKHSTAMEVFEILELCVKPMFKGNFLWRFIARTFHKDLKIPFITGYWTKRAIETNLVTNAGLAAVAGQVNGVTTAPMTAIAIGTGTTAANAADTALETEITTNGGERGAATTSRVTTTQTNDTSQWVKTFNFTGSFAVTEEGVLDNNTSGGNLLAHQVFTAVNVVSGDSLQITHKVAVS